MDKLYLLILLGSIFLIFEWMFVLNLRGKVILGLVIVIFVTISIKSYFWGVSVLALSLFLTIMAKVLAIRKSDVYTPAEATFETNEILRGLSPVEAGYFIGLDQNELLLIAIFELLDKGVLAGEFDLQDFLLNLSDMFEPAEGIISPAERTAYRNNIARSNDQFLHDYDDLILEMVPPEGKISIVKLDGKLWYKIFLDRIQRIEPAYQIQKTRIYASQIIDKYISRNSEFSSGKTNLSGWYAAAYYSGKITSSENHRPAWIRPGDDFQSTVISLLEKLDR